MPSVGCPGKRIVDCVDMLYGIDTCPLRLVHTASGFRVVVMFLDLWVRHYFVWRELSGREGLTWR